VGEDGLHGKGILHGGDDAQAATTAGQASKSRSNTRRMSAADVHARGVGARGLVSGSGALASGAGRP
jgi:hypothetical protein